MTRSESLIAKEHRPSPNDSRASQAQGRGFDPRRPLQIPTLAPTVVTTIRSYLPGKREGERMKSTIATLFLALVSVFPLAAQSAHVLQAVDQTKWGAAPPMLPAGAQIAVLSGDPSKAVPFTIRLKFP